MEFHIKFNKLLFILFIIIILGETGWLARYVWLDYWHSSGVTPETRGFRLALKLGCFTCHGPSGTSGIQGVLGDAPSWDGGTWMMYARTEDEIRNWILYGSRFGPDKEDQEKRKQRESSNPSKVIMPAYADVLNRRQVEDLVSFYKAVSWFRQPQDPEVAKGREIAEKAGCFHCHGPEGRLNMENPGSFKGYIPAWYGADFNELVRNDTELREWILDGVAHRLRSNPAAMLFLKRQKVHMPKYRDKLTTEEIQSLIRYIHWMQEAS